MPKTGVFSFLSLLLALSPSRILAIDVTIRLVKSDKPHELVDATVPRDPKDFPVGYAEKGTRVEDWVKGCLVDGKAAFQRRHKGKFLFRKASVVLKGLEDGEHVIWPGDHRFTLREGQLASSDSDISIKGNVVSLKCYPLTVYGFSWGKELLPFAERAAPLRTFGVCARRTVMEDVKDERQPVEKLIDLVPRYREVRGYNPLRLYLPASQVGGGYCLLPAEHNFALVGGKVTPSPGESAARARSGVSMAGSEIGIPFYTFRMTLRTPYGLGIGYSATGLASGTARWDNRHFTDPVTVERTSDYVYTPRPIPLAAGYRGPCVPIDVEPDPGLLPIRSALADNTDPSNPEARLVLVALPGRTVKTGGTMTVRVRFRDAPEKQPPPKPKKRRPNAKPRPPVVPGPPTLGDRTVAAFIREHLTLPDAVAARDRSARGEWLRVAATPAGSDRFELRFPETKEGLYELAIAVGDSGSLGPEWPLTVVERIAIQGGNTLSVFTQDGRQCYYEGETVETIAVLRNESAFTGNLQIDLVDGDTGQPVRIVSRNIESAEPPEHTWVFVLGPAITTALRPGAYRLRASLPGCSAYVGPGIQIVSRERRSPMHIDFAPMCEGSGLKGPGYELVRDYIESFHVSHLNEFTIAAGHTQWPNDVPECNQEWAELLAAPGLPAAGVLYEPGGFRDAADQAIGRGLTFWALKSDLVENLRWGLPDDLDMDRRFFQLVAQQFRGFPNFRGLRFNTAPTYDYSEGGGQFGQFHKPQRRALLKEVFKKDTGERFPEIGELFGAIEENDLRRANLLERWRRRIELRCSRYDVTYGQYRDALRQIKSDILCSTNHNALFGSNWTLASVPEYSLGSLDQCVWGNYSDYGTWPYIDPFCVDYSRMGNRGIPVQVALNLVAPQYGQAWSAGFQTIGRDTDDLSCMWAGCMSFGRGGMTPANFPRRNQGQALFRMAEQYGALFQAIERRDELAVLFSFTQYAFESRGGEIAGSPEFGEGRQYGRVIGLVSSLMREGQLCGVVSETQARNGALKDLKGLILVGVEVDLPSATKQAILEFQKKGGLLFTDKVCRIGLPGAVRLDCDFLPRVPLYNGQEEFVANYRMYQENVGELRAKLLPNFTRFAEPGNPQLIVSTLYKGKGRYVVAANDGALPGLARLQWGRRPQLDRILLAKGDCVVYDAFDLRRISPRDEGDRRAVVADFRNIHGRLYACLPRPIGSVALEASSSAALGEAFRYRVRVLDEQGSPIEAAVPIEIQIVGPQDDLRRTVYRTADGSRGYEGTFRVGVNDIPGEYAVRVTELFAGTSALGTTQAVGSVQFEFTRHVAELGTISVYDADEIAKFLARTKEVLIPTDINEGREVAAAVERLRNGLARRGIKCRVGLVDETMSIRGRGDPAQSYDSRPPKYKVDSDVIVVSMPGRNRVLQEFQRTDLLPCRISRQFPGRGRGLVAFAWSPFQFGYGAVIIAGGDQAGLDAAVDAFLEGAKARALAPGRVRYAEQISRSPLEAGTAGARRVQHDFRTTLGTRVLGLKEASDGRLFAWTESVLNNLFELDGQGRLRRASRFGWSVDAVVPQPDGLAVLAGEKLIFVDGDGKRVRHLDWLKDCGANRAGDVILASGRHFTHGLDARGDLLWRHDHWAVRKTLDDFKNPYTESPVVSSPDGTYYLSPTERSVKCTNLKTGEVLWTLPLQAHDKHAVKICFSPDSEHFAFASGIWVPPRNAPRATKQKNKAYVCRRDGKLVATRRFTKPFGSEEVGALRPITHLQFTSSGRGLVVKLADGETLLLSVDGGTQRRTRLPRSVAGLHYDEDGDTLYVADLDRIRAVDWAGAEKWSRPIEGALCLMGASKAGPLLYFGTCRGRVGAVDQTKGEVLWQTDLSVPAFVEDAEQLYLSDTVGEKIIDPEAMPKGTEKERIERQVELGANLLPEGGFEAGAGAWRLAKAGRANEARAGNQALALEAGGSAKTVLRQSLKPLATYYVHLWWRSKGGRLSLVTGTVNKSEKPKLRRRQFLFGGETGWAEASLVVKTGREPVLIALNLAAEGGDLLIDDVEVLPLNPPGENLAFVSAAYDEVTEDLADRAPVDLKMWGQEEWEATRLDPYHLVDGKLDTMPMGWAPYPSRAPMRYIDLTFRRPLTARLVAFYDDPAKPESVCQEYIVQAWIDERVPATPKEEDPERPGWEEDEEEPDVPNYTQGHWVTVGKEIYCDGFFHVVKLPDTKTDRIRVAPILTPNEQIWSNEIEVYGQWAGK